MRSNEHSQTQYDSRYAHTRIYTRRGTQSYDRKEKTTQRIMPLNFPDDADGRTLLAWAVLRLCRFHARTATQIEPRNDNSSVRWGPIFGEHMTSEERHKARDARRRAKRAAKREAALKPFDSYEKVISTSALVRAANLSKKGVAWKASVQRFHINLLRNTWALHEKLARGESVVQGFICFDLCERGKLRHIRSVHFKERVVQRSLCDNALVLALSRGLVYDNGASLEGKGIHFAMFRCKKYLQEYYRKHRTNRGWVLQIDFKGYFDNIEHEPIREMLDNTFTDERLKKLTWDFVQSFGEKSVGIGSQVSQIIAVAYPNRIDHYAVEMLGLRGLRYMDDSIYFSDSKAALQEGLEKLKAKYAELGIRLNPKKTQIIPLRRFTFLKVRYELTETGKVIMRPCRESNRRQRAKLKKFKRFVETGEMTIDDVRGSYESWRGYNHHLDGYKTRRNMDKLYRKLFGLVPAEIKRENRRKNKCTHTWMRDESSP